MRVPARLALSAWLAAAGLAAEARASAQAERAPLATSRSAAAFRATLPADDLVRLHDVIEAVEANAADRAASLAARIEDPVARRVAEWALVRRGVPLVGSQRMAKFLADHPEFGANDGIRRRMEVALMSERAAPAAVRAAFRDEAPRTFAGKLALAFALDGTAEAERALELVREAWRSDLLGDTLERRVLERFGPRLTAADHMARLELALERQRREIALRQARLLGPDHARLVEARFAAQRRGPATDRVIEAVPAALRKEPSYVLSRAQALRRKGESKAAAELLATLPEPAGARGERASWWSERRLIARQMLDQGETALAYAVAAGHDAESDADRLDAEWHAGWIALRFRDRPDLARQHFARAAEVATMPISIARAAYWQGRAAEAEGDGGTALRHYRDAARQPLTYYGQVARAKLGWGQVTLREPAAAETLGLADEDVAAIRWLEEAGAPQLARQLAIELARNGEDADGLQRLALHAARREDPALMVTVGKLGVQRGLALDHAAFPHSAMPETGAPPAPLPDVERSLVYAIARQESLFNPEAMSHAGARGLMQLMPATARETARRIGLEFALPKLTAEPAYNARIGTAHLGELLQNWRGSYILVACAYNAGPGNARRWVQAYGDPREPGVDVIDWIERIPFSETRNYVQRIIENLQVYRARFGDADGLRIASDLERGGGTTGSLPARPPERPVAGLRGTVPQQAQTDSE